MSGMGSWLIETLLSAVWGWSKEKATHTTQNNSHFITQSKSQTICNFKHAGKYNFTLCSEGEKSETLHEQHSVIEISRLKPGFLQFILTTLFGDISQNA